MLRWAWWEAQNEPVEYWYCLECDKEEREPCIQVLPRRESMGQPVDIYLWPIFQTIKEEIDDLQKLLNAEKRHTYGELERLMKRILEIERQHAKRKEG